MTASTDTRMRALERAYMNGDPDTGLRLLGERLRLGLVSGEPEEGTLVSGAHYGASNKFNGGQYTDLFDVAVDPSRPLRYGEWRFTGKLLAGWGEDGDYAEWSGAWIGTTADGRWFYADGSCDTTGWDCQGGISVYFCDSLDAVLMHVTSDDVRRILGAPRDLEVPA